MFLLSKDYPFFFHLSHPYILVISVLQEVKYQNPLSGCDLCTLIVIYFNSLLSTMILDWLASLSTWMPVEEEYQEIE